MLFADASRIDLSALRREATVPARLLGIGLPLTIVAGALRRGGAARRAHALEAVVLAVVLAPTDAALGQAVVTEKRLPSRIRQGLNVESGLNDGICVPLLLIVLAAAEVESSQETTGGAVQLVVEQIGYGVVGGVAGGAAAAAVLLTVGRRGWIDGAWLQVALAGAAASYGLALGLGGSGFIAAFVGGGVHGFLRRRRRRNRAAARSAGRSAGCGDVSHLRRCAPPAGYRDHRRHGRRLCRAQPDRDPNAPRRHLDAGHGRTVADSRLPGLVGPRGLASIVFAAIVVEEADLPHTNVIVSTTLVAVAPLVLAHGVSASPLVRRYVAWYESHPRERAPAMESVTAADHRWRHPASA